MFLIGTGRQVENPLSRSVSGLFGLIEATSNAGVLGADCTDVGGDGG